MAYRIALSPPLANLHNVFHVSQLRRYILDPSHVIQVDEVKVKDNLTTEASPIWIKDREVKKLRCKEIALVNIVWEGPAGGSLTWEREEQMRESYPTLFFSGNFRGQKLYNWGRVVTPRFFLVDVLIFYLLNMPFMMFSIVACWWVMCFKLGVKRNIREE